jgi:ribose transport system substrate-binding protein
VQALFASNETSTAGAAQAMKARQSTAKLVGFDASPALVADLRGGAIDALVVQHPFKMGYECVQSAVKKLGGQPVQKIQDLAPRLVTRDNVDQPDVREQIEPDLKKYLG